MDCNDFEFPFSRGCSFYEVNSQGLITSARDCVEPALKPGSTALYVSPACRPVPDRPAPESLYVSDRCVREEPALGLSCTLLEPSMHINT